MAAMPNPSKEPDARPPGLSGDASETPDVSTPRADEQENDHFHYKHKKDELGPVLYKFLKDLDHNGQGHLTQDDLQHIREVFHMHKEGSFLTAEGEIDYTKMPPAIRDALKVWDLDGSGGVNVEDLAAAAKHHQALQKSNKRYHLVLPLLAVGLILSCAVTFIMSFAAAEMAKEIKTGNSGAIMTTDGSPARIASSDMTVNPDGTLVMQSSAEARRLGLKNDSKPLATRPAATTRGLSSTIPDKLFDEMSKLTINGPDGVSHMTMTILGFTRVLTPSKCGSLVHLDTKHGTVVLDDSILHFDEALSKRAMALGIELEGVSAHGRRLASGAEVAGIFSFFEDYDWQCDSVPVPQSPTAPYIIKTIKRVSCPSTSQCSSYMGGKIMYPGYEAKSGSVIVAETLVETEDFFLSVLRYPNHPLQSLVTLTDHKSKKSHTMQIFNRSAHHCIHHNYSAAVGNATDSLSSYFAAYLGFETRSAEEFDLPWGNVTIPQKSVRAFRLQPREGVDGALPIPIDYDDDATTLLPTRLFFNGAEQMQLDVKEILVESLQQDAQAAAVQLRNSVDFPCGDGGISDVPVIISPVSEKKDDVDFYAKGYSSTEEPTSSYWIQAVAEEDEANLQEEKDAESGSSRRLLSKRSPRNLQIALDGGFDIDLGKKASLSAQIIGNCLTVAGSTSSPASPWSFGGELNMGNGCESPSNRFSVDGKVHIAYGWGVEKSYELKVLLWKAKIDVECGLEIGGYIGGKTGTYTYDCGHRRRGGGRRLGNEEHGEAMSKLIAVNHTLEADAEDIEEEEGKPSEQDAADSTSSDAEEDGADARRLLGRRRRDRRRRTCRKTGFEILAGVGVSGGCGISRRRIGVSLEGGLDLSLGPWPSPLDARAKATITAKACIKIGPFGGCVGIPTQQLFDLNI